MKATFCAVTLILLALFTGCGGGSKSGSSSGSGNTSATLSSIQVTPSTMSIGMGATQSFAATGQYSDGSSKDLTASVQWNSSDSAIASIVAGGVATGSNPGTVSISAKSGTVQGSAALTVTAAASNLTSIAIAPAASSMAKNTSQQFTATGSYSNGTSADLSSLVTWSSSSPATATISATGLVNALATGSTTISASLAGVTQSTTVTVTAPSVVSIAVTPEGLTLGIGINQPYVATATYSDGSSADLSSGVTWSSSSTSVATVDNNGLVATVAAGSTTVTATFGSFTDTATLTVVPAHLTSIAVTPSVQTIAAGTSLQFSAIGSFDDGSTQLLTSVSWTTSSSSIATVDSNGFANGVGGGSASITATSGSVSGTASLTVSVATLVSIAVTPNTPSMAVGTTKQFTATGTFSDSSQQDITSAVLWTSSTPAVATVSAQGLATSLATGTTTVKATFGGVSGSTTLTVSTAHLVSITIDPANPRIAKGTSLKLTATGTFSDGSVATNLSGISWKSSKPSIASMRSSGIVHGKKGGSATISASASGITGTTTLTVGTGTLVFISITPTTPSATAGGTLQFTATGNFSDTSTQDITLNTHWSSSSASVATIANAPSVGGLATCNAAGTTTIGANSGGTSSSVILTVH
jgi:trimeric autotransporter adhesin